MLSFCNGMVCTIVAPAARLKEALAVENSRPAWTGSRAESNETALLLSRGRYVDSEKADRAITPTGNRASKPWRETKNMQEQKEKSVEKASTAMGRAQKLHGKATGRKAHGTSMAERKAVEMAASKQDLTESVKDLGLLIQGGAHVHNSIFYNVLNRCTAQKDLILGRSVHALCAKAGYESDAFLANHIICMYASHGRLNEAMHVFMKVTEPSLQMWASIILAHARLGHPVEAIELYRQMRDTHLTPDSYIFVAVLKACTAAQDLFSGRQVYEDIMCTSRRPSLFVGNCLIDMFSKCGSLENARRVFENMSIKDVVTWNSIIAGYANRGLGKEALALFGRMQSEGATSANYVTYLSLLQACASVGALHIGRQLHEEIVERGFDTEVAVGNCLVHMYAKCGSMNDARRVFDTLSTRDVVTWNAIIAGYSEHGPGQEALALYRTMQQENIVQGDAFTFACLLHACGHIGALNEGEQLHAEIQGRQLETDVVVGTCLVDMYSKCERLEDARKIFDNMPVKNVVTWTAMIAGYAQQGLGQESLALYAIMLQEGVTPANQVTFACLLQACSSIQDLQQGRELHTQIRARGFDTDAVVGTCLVDMYAKCGSLDEARRVFNNLPVKNVITWTVMIGGFAQHGSRQDVLKAYESMQHEGISPGDADTIVSLLQAFCSVGALRPAKQLHAKIQERGLEGDLVVGNCLINLYVKCGSLEDAREVFDMLSFKDAVTWNTMIAGYCQQGCGHEALALYASMELEAPSLPNAVTFVCLLQACASIKALCQGKQLHTLVLEKELESDNVVGTCLVYMYAQCGSLEDARKVFDTLETKDVVTWTAMIAAYTQHGLSQEALSLYAVMDKEGITPANAVTFVCVLQACGNVAGLEMGRRIHAQISETDLHASDKFVANTLVDMYGKCGSMVDAQHVFDSLHSRGTVTWNALIAGYARQGESRVVFELFDSMRRQGVRLDEVTFLSVLTVCSHVGLVDKGQTYFEIMTARYGIASTIEHYCCMVDLLGRAGQVEKAIEMVQNMPFPPDIAVWRCVLSACQKWSNVELAREAFRCAMSVNAEDSSVYVLMANIYASAKMQNEARAVLAMRVNAQVWKKPGMSWWTDSGGMVHAFVVGSTHAESDELDAELTNLSNKLKEAGHVVAHPRPPGPPREDIRQVRQHAAAVVGTL